MYIRMVSPSIGGDKTLMNKMLAEGMTEYKAVTKEVGSAHIATQRRTGTPQRSLRGQAPRS
jgi:uncharacterized protein YjaZ